MHDQPVLRVHELPPMAGDPRNSDGDCLQLADGSRLLAYTDFKGGMVHEPGLIELQNGRVMIFSRTDAGSQYLAYSRDQGQSWSPLHASDITS
ncbi:MAG: glycoside hydrolase, partial [Anaerolineae bacterium]|nr:glycoside hydrolase [Anaerolineae bacterium]